MDTLGPKQRKWVDELRSGNYKQGRSWLHSNAGYCCLGVANESLSLGEKHLECLQNTFLEIGLLHRDGWFSKPIFAYGRIFTSLTSMNDRGLTFQDIAFVIENYAHLIFSERV